MLLYTENRVILASAVSSQYTQHWRQSSELTFKVIQGQWLLLLSKAHICILLVINCHLSSISHRFRDTYSIAKTTRPSLSPRLRGPHLNFAIKLFVLKGKTLRNYATFMWKPCDLNFSRLVTIHSIATGVTDRQQTDNISWQQLDTAR